ncbi:MAG TPA: transposase [Thermoanaerobaculia bacterium]|jgi:REP element-mobilizing transposase RayT|nr:transposase [Thermoanaerobaculia bacterium]
MGATYFVTFSTILRRELTSQSRDIALSCCVHDHRLTFFLNAVCVMPDHVHMAFTPYEQWRLPQIMRRVKGVSSRLINQADGVRGHLWQDESFDRIMRSHENVRKKCEYICANPVRAGLASSPDGYRWIWRSWVEGGEEE